MEIMEEEAERLIARLKAELERRAANRGWTTPTGWSDEIVRTIQEVFDQEKIEIARRMAKGLASPFATMRLIK